MQIISAFQSEEGTHADDIELSPELQLVDPNELLQEQSTGDQDEFFQETLHNDRRISSIGQLCEAFGIDYESSIIHNMPSPERRSSSTAWESKNEMGRFNNITKFYKQILNEVANIVCGPVAAKLSIDALWKSSEDEEKHQVNEKILENITQVMSCTKRSSVERKTARAILCSSSRRHDGDGILGYRIDKAQFYRGKQDFEDLISIGYLPTASRTLRRFSPVQADLAISFILSPDNVSYLSWGTRVITFDGKKHQFPCIDRKK